MVESSERNIRNTAVPNGRRECCRDNGRTLPAELVVITVAGMLVIAGAYTFVQMNRIFAPDISATQMDWNRIPSKEDEQLILTLDVTRRESELDSYYITYAPNYDLAKVGRRDVFVPGGGPETVRMDVPVATRELTAVGNVYGCSTDISELLALVK